MRIQKEKMSNNISPIIPASLLVVLGILFRTIWHLGPNVEFVTTATLLAGAHLGKRWALIVPLLIMIISDVILGNTAIFLFTWSAYLFIGFFSNLNKQHNLHWGSKIVHATGTGIIASLWFYLWTNFGVWLLDTSGMYPKSFSGLLESYLLAIPFLKYNLYGNLLFLPISFFVAEKIKKYCLNLRFFKKNDQIIIKL